MTADIADLVERVRRSDDPEARNLAEIVARAIGRPDRRVGSALTPKRRGGEPEWRAEQRRWRDSGYRDFAVAEYGTALLTPGQAKAVVRKVGRCLATANAAEGGGGLRDDAIRRIKASKANGVADIGPRQLLRILSEPEKKL